jgi:hypothetical protein
VELATIGDYIATATETAVLDSPLVLPVPCFILREQEWKMLLSDPHDALSFYNEVGNRYPGSNGVVSLSRVGFNSTATQALTEVGLQGGPRSGHGTLFLLHKVEQQQWTVVDSTGTWMS